MSQCISQWATQSMSQRYAFLSQEQRRLAGTANAVREAMYFVFVCYLFVLWLCCDCFLVFVFCDCLPCLLHFVFVSLAKDLFRFVGLWPISVLVFVSRRAFIYLLCFVFHIFFKSFLVSLPAALCLIVFTTVLFERTRPRPVSWDCNVCPTVCLFQMFTSTSNIMRHRKSSSWHWQLRHAAQIPACVAVCLCSLCLLAPAWTSCFHHL